MQLKIIKNNITPYANVLKNIKKLNKWKIILNNES